MTCTIRNLKRSPTGRESVRERDFDGTQISFGRDVTSDVQLEDLSVALHHAKLSYDESGRIFLDINAGQHVSVDNRICTGRIGPLKTGAILKIGPFLVKLEAPTENAKLVALVERLESETREASHFDEAKVFELKRSLPSKRLMAWVFSLAILLLCLALPIQISQNPKGKVAELTPFQADLSWNSGPISLMHSNLKHDCKSCHVNGWEAVTDTTCLDCHKDLQDHASAKDMRVAKPDTDAFETILQEISESFGRPADRCTSCHVEHNDREHIMPSDQSLCSDCHADLDTHLPETKLLNVSDFGNNHPQFRPVVITEPRVGEPVTMRLSLDDNPKGFSGLKFPHDIHLSATGGVAKMAGTLDARYEFSDGVDCADCHREEAGGALFEPVSMTTDCAMCHSIVFEDDDGFPRTLRHGQPREVIASMRDFYDAKALGNIRDAEMNTTTRRRPGRASSLRALNRRELAFKQSELRTIAKVDAIFSEGGACYDCHVIDRPEDVSTMAFTVRPISVSDAFYPRSPFDHEAHEINGLSCKSCHAAETSKSSDDILLPKIDVCRDCHIGEESYRNGGALTQNAFPTNCLTCHGFHDGQHAQAVGEYKGSDE